MTYMSNYPQAPDGNDPWAWAWRKIVTEAGEVEWYGASQYHNATVTYQGTGWQATMSGTGSASSGHLNRCSPYRATVAAAKAWAERYGMTRDQLKRRREQGVNYTIESTEQGRRVRQGLYAPAAKGMAEMNASLINSANPAADAKVVPVSR